MIIFFFNDTATTEIYTLSLHDALPICWRSAARKRRAGTKRGADRPRHRPHQVVVVEGPADEHQPQDRDREAGRRSEEHTSELQSRQYLVCRLLLEKKKTYTL